MKHMAALAPRGMNALFIVICAILLTQTGQTAAAEGYYRKQPQFHFYPDEKGLTYTIQRVGPLGFGVELRQPAFTMYVADIEAGSPADKTGKLKKGQLIESINGEVLKDIDPRIQLGDLITKIEATDGIAKLMIKDDEKSAAYTVEIKIPVLGDYSDAWPVNCRKSDAIVRNFADFLDRTDKSGWGAALFLLSTGEDKDLNVVRRWFSSKLSADGGGIPWDIGYAGPAICEYYLRTGDESVLPAIKSKCDYLKRTIYNGAWMGRGGANYGYMAGGHMNAAGAHCVNFLLLAKECGVDVDEHTLQSSLLQFYRYAGHNNVPYGDGLPEGGFTDNGKVGGLAFAMAAAASLTPDGENSVYAKARDISATKSFYSTSWLFHGHTGGGIGEIWRGAAMGLMKDKRPAQYRSFMDERRWLYELSRCHDGAFGISGGPTVGGKYEVTGRDGGRAFGNYLPLIYTIPKKQLRIFGAPATKYCKTYQLPKRPWGTAADEAFLSLTPAEYAPGKVQDISKELLPADASMPIMSRINNPDVSDETLVMYAHHIDQGIRESAAGNIAKPGRNHLIVPLLKSVDPRVRQAGLFSVLKMGESLESLDEALLTEIMQLAAGMITDPEESWWVVESALKLLGQAEPELLAQHTDRLQYWLEHDEWWLRKAALTALTPIVTDERFCKRFLPIIGKMITKNERAVALSPVGGIVSRFKEAAPEVQALAVEALAEAYSSFPGTLSAPGGQNMSSGVNYLIDKIAGNLAALPGGLDALFKASRRRFPGQTLPHQDIVMNAEASDFSPELREAMKPLVLTRLIPEFIAQTRHIGSNRKLLLQEVNNSVPFSGNGYYKRPRVEDLSDLYTRVGINGYDWQDFGPKRSEIKWDYFSFDPPEEKMWTSGTRYRKVTLPSGMENWHLPEFDSKAAGWKTGLAPFGQLDGKPAGASDKCVFSYCRCDEPVQTLWEKEVLLLRGKVKLPPFQDGYRYRLVVGGLSHNFAGDGIRLYVNGKQMIEAKAGTGKRDWGRMAGYYIDKAWWKDFANEPTIAATSFLAIPGGKRSLGVKKGYLSVWVQAMKCPPFGEKEILNSIKAAPLQPSISLSPTGIVKVAAQEEEGEPENSGETATAVQTDKALYKWDGKFAANDSVLGSWKQVGIAESIAKYKPGVKLRGGPMPGQLTFLANGKTSDPLFYYTGDVLMDLDKNQALKMQVRKNGKEDLLVIERTGGDQNQIPVTVYRKAPAPN
jgi:hypothetical protein